MHLRAFLPALLAVLSTSVCNASDANRLTYLDRLDPYYASGDFPKLITPQWLGEDGVDAVVIFAVDDMQKPRDYEKFLRPILNRLERIDGKAHLSIMTRSLDPKDPLLQQWLKEGVSLETHTIDHPCPLLQGGDFAKAKSTYDRCVDLLSQVPNSHPVAFRMPCCDSKNTPSPRVFAEIFNQTTPNGNFVRIDSSVFNIYTANDPVFPRNLVIDPDGRERFRK
ncbi:MAG TPA: polysaccharide deacetylase family protein, partial [Tepidisphaeraceae bacterium]|nr:polysaccharide deacetylase family protein [Tepidisphaeraceae bacterium]